MVGGLVDVPKLSSWAAICRGFPSVESILAFGGGGLPENVSCGRLLLYQKRRVLGVVGRTMRGLAVGLDGSRGGSNWPQAPGMTYLGYLGT